MAMAASPLRSRHLSSTIFRFIHGRCHRRPSSSLPLPPPPRRRSSPSETRSPRHEKKQDLSRLGLSDREGEGMQYNCVGRLLRDVRPELGDSSIQASKDGDNERLQSLAGEEIWAGVEDKGVGENETHEDVKYSSVPSQEEIVHLIRCQKTPSQSLETFRWASEIPDFCHSQSTYKALVRKLCAFGKFQLVHELIEEMPHYVGSPPDDDLFIAVIRGFCHARKGRKVVRILDWVRGFGRQPSLKLFNAVLDVLVGHDIELARDFYREKMMGSGVGGDHFTFGILMKGLCSTNRIGEAFKLLAQMKSHGLQPNTVIYNMLIHSLCRNGKVGRGRSLMSEMVEPNDVTFSILICEYCKDGKLIQALVMLEKCFGLGYVPNVVTVTKVVELLCTEGRGMEAAELLERVERMGGNVDVLAYNTLIKGFCMLGKAKVGEKLLKEMEGKGCLPNVHTYKILIAGLCDIGNVDSALDLLHEMDFCGLNADLATYEMLIECFCRVGRTCEGLTILKLMEDRHNLDHCMNSFYCIIYGFYRENKIDEAQCFISEMGKYFPALAGESMKILNLCKEGSILEAVDAYNSMVSNELSPNALVYVCLIDKLSEEGEMHRALELINEMVIRGYFPIPSTFGSLINGFCQRGQIESANRILDEMMKRDCSPIASCINPVIDYFCGKGEYNKACELLIHVTEKDTIPDEKTWSSLLMNNAVELGQGVFESLLG